MNTPTKLAPYLSIIIVVAFASCKGKPGSTTVKDSTTTATTTTATTTTVKNPGTPASRVNFVIDSLGITDAAEKKVCVVYDDAVTAYTEELKNSLADTTNVSLEKKKAIDKEFDDKFKAIQPEVDKVKKQLSPMEAIKMIQFISGYEMQREGPVISAYSSVLVNKSNAMLTKKVDSIKKSKN